MSGGGKSSTSTSSVSIPPEVLARYNAVNTRAEATGQIPFQPYTGEFVAPLSQTQQAGIANINQAAGMAQPYYQAAGSAITGGAAQAQPYYQAATNQVYGGLAAAQPLQQASMANQIAAQSAGTGALQGAFGASQPVMQGALTGLSNIPVQSLPLQQQALLGISQAQASADPFQQASYGSLMQAGTQAQPYTREASQALSRGEFAAQPMQQMAGQGISAAQAAGAPYQQLATQYGLAGARQIDPNALNVQQYMSPYIESVAQPTLKALQQQQQQEQQKILGDQIRSGAFGGDRGKIAQAVLAQQQGLATGQAMGNIYQQGYGQALSTAQQQQQTALAAEQANRAAQQAAAQQMLGIGQQGFGQEMAAAQQRAALGQQLFGQGVAGAQQRAALGQQVFGQGAQTAQQQAALAQQLYGQGLAGAQAQQGVAQQMINQGLGIAGQQAGIGQNLFGQGAQAAQQLYGMGAGTAQQQAALAQQQYAQQMGAAQQLQGLGQGLFGIGSGVSQGLTGIGGAAQQAALQGGQAQLGAGTVEQQTQQALNQANYNQFLQQQGYPYQVAQFLANIAMGTGALSGSTTTTTQPSSFFSDKRLKDDIEPIGKTYDGQEIVRYRYKGEPATRIGLVAQDVEKKHPEAVGLAGGFKTVDYDKATDDAAARAPKAYGGGLNPWTDASMGGGVFREDAGAGFAAGGSPGDDILAQINALVNSHQGMFPYGKAGMYGSGMGKAGPYGSTLMQPSNRQLMRADPVRQAPQYDVRQAMRDVKDIQEMPRAVSQTYSGLKRGLMGAPESTSQVTNQGGQTTTQTTPASGGLFGRGGEFQWEGSWLQQLADAAGMANGGGVRQGLAAGGLPYSSAEDEYVPEDISAPIKPAGLQPAKPPPPGRTTGDDLMTMAKLATMFAGGFASGGLVPRQGYQAGGEPEEDTIAGYRRSAIEDMFNRGIIPNESGGRQFNERGEPLRSSAGAVGIGQIMPSTGPEAARLAGVSWDPERFERDPNYNRQLGLAYFTQQLRQHGDPLRAAAAYNAGPGRLGSALAGGEDYFSRLPNETQDYLRRFYSRLEPSGLIPPALASSVLNAQAAPAQPTGVAPPAASQRETQTAESPDWFKERLAKNEYWLVPLLTGLGTMASSPSRYLGSAVLQGLMGAGQAYQGQVTAEGQRALTAQQIKTQEAQEGQTRMITEEVAARIAGRAYNATMGTVLVQRPDGRGYQFIPISEYTRLLRAGRSPVLGPAGPAQAGEATETSPTTPSTAGGGTQREATASPAGSTVQREVLAPPPGAQTSERFSQEPPALPGGGERAQAPTTQASPQAPIYRQLTPELQELAQRRAEEVRDLPGAVTGQAPRDPSIDIWENAQNRANAALNSSMRRNDFASLMAYLPDTGVLAAGRFGQEVGLPLVDWVNSMASALGFQRGISPEDLANRRMIDKLVNELGAESQAAQGSRAFAEFSALLRAIPNGSMPREAAAGLIAEMYAKNQRDVDFNNFAQLYANATGLSPTQVRYAGRGLPEAFANEQDRKYPAEKQFITDLYMNKIDGKPLLDFVIKSQGNFDPRVRSQLEEMARARGANFSEVLRYFRM